MPAGAERDEPLATHEEFNLNPALALEALFVRLQPTFAGVVSV